MREVHDFEGSRRSSKKGHDIEFNWVKSLESLDKSPFLDRGADRSKGKCLDRSPIECLHQGLRVTDSQKETQRWVRGITGEIPLVRVDTLNPHKDGGKSLAQLPRVLRSAPASPEKGETSKEGHDTLDLEPQVKTERRKRAVDQPLREARSMSISRSGPIKYSGNGKRIGETNPSTPSAPRKLTLLSPLTHPAVKSAPPTAPPSYSFDECDSDFGFRVDDSSAVDSAGKMFSEDGQPELSSQQTRSWALSQCRLQTHALSSRSRRADAHKQQKELRRQNRGTSMSSPISPASSVTMSPCSESDGFFFPRSAPNSREGSVRRSVRLPSCHSRSLRSRSMSVRQPSIFSGTASATICPSITSILYFPTDDPAYRRKQWTGIVMCGYYASVLTRKFEAAKQQRQEDMAMAFFQGSSSYYRSLDVYGARAPKSPLHALRARTFKNFDDIPGTPLSPSKIVPKSPCGSRGYAEMADVVRLQMVQSGGVTTKGASLRRRHANVIQNKQVQDKLRYAYLTEKIRAKSSKPQSKYTADQLKRLKNLLCLLQLGSRTSIYIKYQTDAEMKKMAKKYHVRYLVEQVKAASTLKKVFHKKHFENVDLYGSLSKNHGAAGIPEHVKKIGKDWSQAFQVRRRQKMADIITKFLRRVSWGHQINFLVGKLMVQVRLLQKSLKGYRLCNEARIQLLSLQWRRLEKLIMKQLHLRHKNKQEVERRKQINALTDHRVVDKWLPTRAYEMENIRKDGDRQFRSAQRILDDMAARDRVFQRFSEQRNNENNSEEVEEARKRKEERRNRMKRLKRRAVDFALTPEKLKMIEEFLNGERKAYTTRMQELQKEYDRSQPKNQTQNGMTIEYLENCLKGPSFEQLGLHLPDKPYFCIVSGEAKQRFYSIVMDTCVKHVAQQRQLHSERLMEEIRLSQRGPRSSKICLQTEQQL